MSGMRRGLIGIYQLVLWPILPPSCRYLPSCSDYAIEALASHGVVAGLWLAARRIARRHPWGGSGYGPGPPAAPAGGPPGPEFGGGPPRCGGGGGGEEKPAIAMSENQIPPPPRPPRTRPWLA